MGFEMWVQPIDPFNPAGPVPRFDGAATAALDARIVRFPNPETGGFTDTAGGYIGETLIISPTGVHIGRPGPAARAVLWDALSLGGVLMHPGRTFVTRDERWLRSEGLDGIAIAVVADRATFDEVIDEDYTPGVHDFRSDPPPVELPDRDGAWHAQWHSLVLTCTERTIEVCVLAEDSGLRYADGRISPRTREHVRVRWGRMHPQITAGRTFRAGPWTLDVGGGVLMATDGTVDLRIGPDGSIREVTRPR